MKPIYTYGATLLTLLSPLALAADDTAANFGEVFTKGDVDLTFRYRYELVDQDGFDEEAGASTLKSRITLKSASLGGFSGLLEVDNVSVIGSERYNSLANGETEYPVVADPDGTDLNQVYLKYKNESLAATGGRQRINHDGQRFVGGVGWRQNEQTFDAFRINDVNLGGLTLDYAYIDQVNRIFGPDDDGVQPDTWESESHVFTSSFQLAEGHTIGAYAYLLEFEDAAANSSDTYGVSYSGDFGGVTLKAAYASQSDAGDNPVSYDADYWMAEVGTKIDLGESKLGLTAGIETLGSDDGIKGFSTPLATLHKFQGWADKFLGTPADGVQDAYVKAATKIGPVKTALIYHEYEADEGSAEYGSEINFVATIPFAKKYSVQLKYADYEAEDFSVDTQKVWLTFNAKF